MVHGQVGAEWCMGRWVLSGAWAGGLLSGAWAGGC